MSWSLQLSHGDFVLSGSTYSAVTGPDKLAQDLRCALGERMGTDDMHPDFGSLIDGGRLPDGTTVTSPIGIGQPNQVAAQVNAEIQRIASAYQAQQLNRAKSDKIFYNRVSLTPSEVLLSIAHIDFAQDADALTVTVTLSTALGQDIAIVLPISN